MEKLSSDNSKMDDPAFTHAIDENLNREVEFLIRKLDGDPTTDCVPDILEDPLVLFSDNDPEVNLRNRLIVRDYVSSGQTVFTYDLSSGECAKIEPRTDAITTPFS